MGCVTMEKILHMKQGTYMIQLKIYLKGEIWSLYTKNIYKIEFVQISGLPFKITEQCKR